MHDSAAHSALAMIATIFTHPPDYPAACLAARSLMRLGVRVFLAIDEADPVPAVEGPEIVRTSFPRNGNLNGKKCVIGELETMMALADDDGYHLKVDSDALVFSLGWLDGKTEDLVGLHHPDTRELYGFCYAIRREAMAGMLERAKDLPDDPSLPEDVTMMKLAGSVHRYRNLEESCPMASYPWSTSKSPSWWKERYDVLLFQSGDGYDAHEIRRKMREFL